MKLNFILLALASTQALHSYPYYPSSDLKNRAVTLNGGSAELEPLETGTMKDLPTKYELTKGLLSNGFKEKQPYIDSIEDKIKGASRNHGEDEMRQISDKLTNQKKVMDYQTKRALELGANWNPNW